MSVELEADGFDMPTLFSSKKIPRSTQFEIKGGDFEARAKVRKFFQCCEATSCRKRLARAWEWSP